MNRHASFGATMLLLVLSVARVPAEEEPSAGPQRANVIVILSDQQRWDTLGCYGQKLAVTPNLDRMAAEGARFEYAFTNQPVSAPARAVLNTGKYATETKVVRNHIRLPPGEKTVANYLSDAGYQTAFVGDWHLGRSHQPVSADSRGGFKDFWLASNELERTSHGYDGHMFDADMKQVDFKGYRADAVTDYALDFIRKRDQTKPFLLHVYHVEPHHQNDHKHFEGPIGSKEKFKDFVTPGDLIGAAGDWRAEMPDYLGCCASLDYNIGRLRDELEKLGIAKNTVIIYTSDHGCHFRTRNKEYKRSPHEASIRVPLVVCGPGFEGGKVIKDLVSLIDIAPTTLACAGVKPPSGMRGRPLQELPGGAKDWPKEVFIQTSESETARALRTDKWKYGIAAQDRSGREQPAYHEKYLYDLEKDPHERKNLAGNPGYSGIRATLAEILKRHIKSTGEKSPRILPAK